MDKHQIANVLAEMALLLELTGGNPFKVRAYQNAARTLEGLTEDLNLLIDEDRLESIPGIGKNLAEHITDLARTGKLSEHDKLRSKVPDGVIMMLAIPGLGPKRVRALWEEWNVKSIGELKLMCKRGGIARIEGFGEKTEKKILAGIESLAKFAGKSLYAEAVAVAREVHEAVSKWPEVIRSDIAGSIRRKKEIVQDIDILISTDDPKKVMERFISLPFAEKKVQQGETKSEIILKGGIQCDLRAVKDDEYPFALHYLTGSKEHNVAMRALAKKAGVKMNEYGLFKGDSKKSIPCRDEEGIFKVFDLAYIEPELRENMGEIEVAAKSGLPRLIVESDIAGVVHCHSNYTDGADSISKLAEAAMDMGFKYLAVTDHSKAVTIAHGMKPADVKHQHKEIGALNRKFQNFRVLKGVECDILADGRLDFDDELLSTFDIVIAAVHSRFSMSEVDMTARIVRALSNPHVDMLAHPTGRLLLAREPYAVDMKRIIDEAGARHKAIEINAHPQRLDLDWRWCKYAKEKGVKMAICPDAHSIEGFEDIRYGVGVARKGWLEKKDVLNTLPAEKFLSAIGGL